MDFLFIGGIALYFAGIFLERQMDAKGAAMLNPDQISQIQQSFGQLKKRNSIANLILALAYLAMLFFSDINPFVLIGGYVVIYLSIFFVVAVFYIRGLKELQFPQPFIRNFISAKFIRVLAFGIFVTTLVSLLRTVE